MKKLLFLSFVLLAVAQLAFPLNMIWQTNRILNHGESIKLLINVNSSESLNKGEIIYPNYKHTYVPAKQGKTPGRGVRIFLILEHKENGYHIPVSYTTERPTENVIYVLATVSSVDSDEQRVFFNWPIREFKLTETVVFPADETDMPDYATINAILSAKALNGKMIPEGVEIVN